MNLPLMPKATAVWLVENTILTFNQISNFCGMHPLEVQGIADGDVAGGITGISPIEKGILTREQISEAEKDASIELQMEESMSAYISSHKKKKSRYTPVARRQDKPDAINWLVKTYPDMVDAQIAKLIGTTKNTISAIRNKEHWNMQNIKSRDPVLLGLCTQTDLYALVDKIETAKAAKEEKELKAKEKKKKEAAKKREAKKAEKEKLKKAS